MDSGLIIISKLNISLANLYYYSTINLVSPFGKLHNYFNMDNIISMALATWMIHYCLNITNHNFKLEIKNFLFLLYKINRTMFKILLNIQYCNGRI